MRAYVVRMSERIPAGQTTETAADQAGTAEAPASPPKPKEIGGPKGPEPTRYGDWEVNGRCSDF